MILTLSPVVVQLVPPLIARSHDPFVSQKVPSPQWIRNSCCKPPLNTLKPPIAISLIGNNHNNSRLSTPFSTSLTTALKQPPKPAKNRTKLFSARASMDVPMSYYRSYPAPTTTKPRWWWRTLACLPYLIPFHKAWMYAETAYQLHPSLQGFEFLTYPFLRSLERLPSWFLMAYSVVAYLWVVRRKECPYFFRFHLLMGLLLENALHVVGIVSGWMPLAVYWGMIGMHFWTAATFTYVFAVVECVRCALSGTYADVPFVSEAAYMQIPYPYD